MENKFNRKDILSFDPANASTEEVRMWLFALIDAELEKAPEERDYDLIAECSDFEAELSPLSAEISESDCAEGLSRIVALVAENKKAKILKPKKKKTIRVISVLAAALAALFLSVTVTATMQGKTLRQFIEESAKLLLDMSIGDKLDEGNITLIKRGESFNYSSVEEAVEAVGWDVFYPTYMPEGTKTERIVIVELDDKGASCIMIVTNNKNLFMATTNIYKNAIEDLRDTTIYETESLKWYIIDTKPNGNYQAMAHYENIEYCVAYNDYDELLKILDGFKEIEK